MITTITIAARHAAVRRVTAAIATAGSLLAALSLATAPTATATVNPRPVTRQVSPLYTCPASSICLFKDTGLAGTHQSWNAQASGGHWIDLHNYSSIMPHRSGHNTSGSDVWLANVSTKNLYCVEPGFSGNFSANAANSGWMWIRYGVNDCNNPPPNPPPGSASRLSAWSR